MTQITREEFRTLHGLPIVIIADEDYIEQHQRRFEAYLQQLTSRQRREVVIHTSTGLTEPYQLLTPINVPIDRLRVELVIHQDRNT